MVFIDVPQSSSETDFNDAGEGPGHDVTGLAGSGSTDGSAGEAVGSSRVEESDAGPFNISGYQRRLPPGVRDNKYG